MMIIGTSWKSIRSLRFSTSVRRMIGICSSVSSSIRKKKTNRSGKNITKWNCKLRKLNKPRRMTKKQQRWTMGRGAWKEASLRQWQLAKGISRSFRAWRDQTRQPWDPKWCYQTEADLSPVSKLLMAAAFHHLTSWVEELRQPTTLRPIRNWDDLRMLFTDSRKCSKPKRKVWDKSRLCVRRKSIRRTSWKRSFDSASTTLRTKYRRRRPRARSNIIRKASVMRTRI